MKLSRALLVVGVIAIIIFAGIAVASYLNPNWQGITLQFYNDGKPVGPVYRQSWLPLSFNVNGQEVDSVVVTAYWEAVGGDMVNVMLSYSEGGGPYEELTHSQSKELKSEKAFTVLLADLFPNLVGDQQLDVDFRVEFQLLGGREGTEIIDEKTATAGILLAWEDDPQGFLAWGVIV